MTRDEEDSANPWGYKKKKKVPLNLSFSNVWKTSGDILSANVTQQQQQNEMQKGNVF